MRVLFMFPQASCLALGLAVLTSACGGQGESVEARLAQCSELVADKDAQDAALDCFTEKSRALLSGLLREQKTSNGLLVGLVSFQELLKYTEVVGSPEVRGETALAQVKKGSQRYTILLERESADGKWRVDVTELPTFWTKLSRNGSEM